MTDSLANRVAVVTGARGGIGGAVCRRLSDEGAAVLAADVAPLGQSTRGLTDVELDVTDETAVEALADRLRSDHGRLDVLVNAAAIEIEKTIEETTLSEWNRIFAINVTGTFLVSKHLAPLMRESGGGSIVNFGSYDGFIADPELAAYCATKGAVHALTRAMAVDYGGDGIRVNAVCPGYIDTPMLQGFFGDSGDIDSLQQKVRDIHPIGRYGTPEDVANLVNWLAGDEARYATGQLWVLDGGLTAQAQQLRL